MAKAVYGIKKFGMGPAGANGAMSTALVDITQIVADSVQVTFPEDEKTEIVPEDYEDAFVVLKTKQAKTVVVKTLNMDVENLKRFFGGTVTSLTLVPGVNFEIPEQSFYFETRPLTGATQKWEFFRADVSASIDETVSKTNVLAVTLTFTILTPNDAEGDQLPSFKITQSAA